MVIRIGCGWIHRNLGDTWVSGHMHAHHCVGFYTIHMCVCVCVFCLVLSYLRGGFLPGWSDSTSSLLAACRCGAATGFPAACHPSARASGARLPGTRRRRGLLRAHRSCVNKGRWWTRVEARFQVGFVGRPGPLSVERRSPQHWPRFFRVIRMAGRVCAS